MNKLLRMASLAATAAAVAFSATPAMAVTSGTDSTARVRILRPLTLVSSANFDLGDILLSGTGTYSATVKLSSANVRTCAANVTCSGTTSVAKYDMTGTKGQVVTISAPNVTLTGPSGTLTLKTTDASNNPYYATSVTLDPTTGAASVLIGGEVTVANTTADGVYTGTFAVTAAYQ